MAQLVESIRATAEETNPTAAAHIEASRASTKNQGKDQSDRVARVQTPCRLTREKTALNWII
jgi:hypothetical protein